MGWPVGGAGSGERTAEAAAAAAGVVGRRSVGRRCRRCCGDIAAAAEIGREKDAQMHLGSELSVRGIGGDEDGGGAGGRTAVNWPLDWRVPR
jgi:hypothetical protein